MLCGDTYIRLQTFPCRTFSAPQDTIKVINSLPELQAVVEALCLEETRSDTLELRGCGDADARRRGHKYLILYFITVFTRVQLHDVLLIVNAGFLQFIVVCRLGHKSEVNSGQ